MNRQYIDDHHIVARYLADQLSDAERQAFEACLLEHPEIVRDLEAAARMKVGLRQLRERGELETLLVATPASRSQRLFAAAAAIAIVGVVLATFMLRPPAAAPFLVASSTTLVDKRGKALPVVRGHSLSGPRTLTVDAEVEVPEKPAAIALRLLPEHEAHPPRTGSKSRASRTA